MTAIFIPMTVVAGLTGSLVRITLNGHHEVEGVLVGTDSTCNIVLDDATHYVETVTSVEPSTVPGAAPGAVHRTVERVPCARYQRMLVNAHHIMFIAPKLSAA